MRNSILSGLLHLALIAGLMMAFQPTAHAQEAGEEDQEAAAMQEGNIVSTLQSEGNFSTLVSALEKTGLSGQLASGQQSFTVFAPTDEAFSSLSEDVSAIEASQLQKILTYHVVANKVSLEQATQQGALSPLEGEQLTVQNGQVNNANIVRSIEASNGIIHVVDAVLQPSTQAGSE
jgi:uncharacterized surface protein with fasciclin (FAS1) repeats